MSKAEVIDAIWEKEKKWFLEESVTKDELIKSCLRFSYEKLVEILVYEGRA